MFEFHSQQKWVKQVIKNDLKRLHSFNAFFAFQNYQEIILDIIKNLEVLC